MASEKVTEVELETISPAEEKESEDADKGKLEEKPASKDEKEAEGKEKEYKEYEEDDEDDPLYSKLKTPTEDIYSLTKVPSSSKEQHEDVYKKVTLYRRLSAILLIICVVLLAVLLALAVKLSEAQSSLQCHPTEESVTEPVVCSPEMCEKIVTAETLSHQNAQAGKPGLHVCSECERGWLKFDNSCFLLSSERRTWQASRERCLQLGGDLVIISSERMQKFLTTKGLMQYWIGLHRSEQDWAWIDNTTLTTGYWTRNLQSGDCVFLNGGKWSKTNWHPSPCEFSSNYICKRG